jgi:hypothetical protein
MSVPRVLKANEEHWNECLWQGLSNALIDRIFILLPGNTRFMSRFEASKIAVIKLDMAPEASPHTTFRGIFSYVNQQVGSPDELGIVVRIQRSRSVVRTNAPTDTIVRSLPSPGTGLPSGL